MGTVSNICVGLADIYIMSSPHEPWIGNVPAWSKVTIETSGASSTDALTINGTVFTMAAETSAADHEFADAAGLVTCINDADHGLSGVTASASTTLVTLASETSITTASVDENYTVTTSDWTKLGFQSENGLSLSSTTEISKIKVPEVGGFVKFVLMGDEAKLSWELMECDFDQMQYFVSGGTYTAASVDGTNPNKLGVGGKTSLTEYGIGFQGLGPSGVEVVGYMSKAYATNEFMQKFLKGDPRNVTAEFEAIMDTTRTAGEQLLTMWEATTA